MLCACVKPFERLEAFSPKVMEAVASKYESTSGYVCLLGRATSKGSAFTRLAMSTALLRQSSREALSRLFTEATPTFLPDMTLM